jgi:excisionase family DNA binding protein
MFGNLALLSTRMAARRLGVSRSCIAAWIRRGYLPAARSGKNWVIRVEDLAKFTVMHKPRQRFFKSRSYLCDRA